MEKDNMQKKTEQNLIITSLRTFLSRGYAPILLGILLLVTFGPFLFRWGFYFDDWPMIFLIKNKGDILEFYSYDRPFAAWTDIALQAILGTKPLLWQFANLIARWFSAIALWWCLSLLWPKDKRQVLYVALLFAIYPVFYQQPIAVTYTHAFLWYTSYFLSIGFMILAVRKSQVLSLSTLLSIFFAIFHMISSEYFWGLELLRPLILWLILKEQRWPQKLKSLLVYWLPWLILLAVATIWRFLIFKPADANSPVILFSLFENPVPTILQLTQTVLQDLLYIGVGAWTNAVQPSTIDFDSTILLLAWGAVLIVSIAAFLVLRLGEKGEPLNDNEQEQGWLYQAFSLGSIGIPISLIPAWIAGRQCVVEGGLYTDRFALPALMGASLVIVSLIETLVSRPTYRRLLIALLLGLAVGMQVRSANNFRRDWNFARDFYWQLYWRVPALQPNSALLSEHGVFQYTAKYALATSINVLYPVPKGTTEVPYWTFELDDLYNDYFYNGIALDFESIQLQDSIRNITFSTSGKNIVLFSYERSKPHCLWVLNPLDTANPYLEELTEMYLSNSNLDRIIPEPIYSDYPDSVIFGPEPPHTWCYYYQKADLARQTRNWEEIIKLGYEAEKLEYGPSNSYEWLPFIEAHLHEGNLEKASELTVAAFDNNNRLDRALCAVWERALQGKSISSEIAYSALTKIGCNLP